MLKLTLVTPEKKYFTDLEVEELLVPGFRGQLNILPGHCPLVTTLSVGELTWRAQGHPNFEVAAISWGYCEVDHDHVIVLAETAELASEIDVERAKNALKKAQDVLNHGPLDEKTSYKMQLKLSRANVRINIAGKFGNMNHDKMKELYDKN
jgi:F-type H+-transporting ATPase subunit epsilon